MVGPKRVVNAVSLNSVIVHSARIVGPAIAGVLIATVGVAPCFAVNAASFGGMILALWRMDPAQLRRGAPPPSTSRGAIRAALRYVRRTPELAVPLALMALVGTLRLQLPGGPAAAGQTSASAAAPPPTRSCSRAMGVGSVVGALATGAHGRTGAQVIAAAALAFGTLRAARGADAQPGARGARCSPCSAAPR